MFGDHLSSRVHTHEHTYIFIYIYIYAHTLHLIMYTYKLLVALYTIKILQIIIAPCFSQLYVVHVTLCITDITISCYCRVSKLMDCYRRVSVIFDSNALAAVTERLAWHVVYSCVWECLAMCRCVIVSSTTHAGHAHGTDTAHIWRCARWHTWPLHFVVLLVCITIGGYRCQLWYTWLFYQRILSGHLTPSCLTI